MPYLILGEVVFGMTDQELDGDMTLWHRLRRHTSCIAGEEGFQGLFTHAGQENPFFERHFFGL